MSGPRLGLTRRHLLRGLGVGAGLGAAPAFVQGPLGDAAEMDSRLFPLGVASGDPSPSGFVIWTRLAPYPLQGGGLGRRVVPVRWMVSSDPFFSNVVRSGSVLAEPQDGHAVRAVVSGLQADRHYWYRFSALGETTRVGRARTFPGLGQAANRMRFALTSCQHYEAGFYAAWRDIAEQDDLDFVFHVGDYIYEGGATRFPIAPGRVHDGPEPRSVLAYRNRYALYKLDDDLKAAHAKHPFIVTWDDHEVDNNYAGIHPEDDQPLEEFDRRRAAAYRVYYETMPLRPAQAPFGSSMPLYRSLQYGDLANILVLDTRQFRTDQPCGDIFGSTDSLAGPLGLIAGQQLLCGDDLSSPSATMTGSAQENWLFGNLLASRAKWNLIAQQVMMMRWNLGPAAASLIQTPLENLYNVDAWDGYPVQRDRVLRFLDETRPANPVVLTGDIHSSWVGNLLADFDDPNSDAVAAEFVGTSISSAFGDDYARLARRTLPANPHIRWFDGFQRGYTLLEVTAARCVGENRGVDNVLDPDSGVSALSAFQVRDGFNRKGIGPEAIEQV